MSFSFDVTPVYHANYNSIADLVINQGGTDSGKTYGLMQLMFTHACTFNAPKVDPIITIVGSTVPNLKKGAYRHAKNISLSTPGLKEYIRYWNETDRTITFITGWVMEFISCQNEQEAKQGKRQYLFVNEANGIDWAIFWQLAKRTRIRTYIDYNPSAPFWAHDKLIGTSKLTNDLSADVQLIISDHRHNTFLSEKDHFRTENIQDPELWKVYARGRTGNLDGLIFKNWKEIPDNQFPDTDFFGGIDYGYTNDPTAAVKIAKVGNSIFVHEICYETSITANNLKSLFYANGFTASSVIYSEHDPDMIAQLRRMQVMAIPARKGAGSINAGIVKLNEYQVYYTASSLNISEERKRYMWQKDKVTGKSINTPTEQWNHLMDAIRYGVYTHFYRS